MKPKTKQLHVLCSLLVILFILIPQVKAQTIDSLTELEAFLDGIFSVQHEQYKVPGISVAIIQDGELLFSKGYGYADFENKVPYDPVTTLHRPGSNSKILVWTAVMQLMEQGLLDLHVDINTYLDFPLPNKLSNGKQTGSITMHDLLTHTAGFEDQATGLFVAGPDAIQPLDQYARNHLPGRVYEPGTTLAYSNYGTALAAYIVELVSGQPFHEYVEQRIFAPLEMNQSTFAQPVSEELEAQMSKGYFYTNGNYKPATFEYIQAVPSGGLSSTTLDMAKLIIAHLNLGAIYGEEVVIEDETNIELDEFEASEENEKDAEFHQTAPTVINRILEESTAKLMQTPQFSDHPEIPGMTYGFIEADYNGYRVLSHGGDTVFFHTGLYFLPEENVGLYVSYNSAQAGPARFDLFNSFMDRYFPPKEQDSSIPKAVAVGTEDNYTGTYHFARGNFTQHEILVTLMNRVTVNFDEDGYLLLTAAGNTSRFGEVNPGIFREINGQEKISFTFHNGKATKIHLGGPHTLLRTPWYRNIITIISILIGSLLIMTLTLLKWIKQLFRSPRNRIHFSIGQIIATIFIIIYITSLVLVIDALTNTHPELGLPMEILQPTSTLNAFFILSKTLLVLAILMLVITIRLWVVRNDKVGPRILYTLISLCSTSVIWVFWLLNLA